ncbi:MAG: nucleotidyltransferase family protein [Thermodesulfobacterium sp.]|nr:nucleotidyltransferase family protein [Thermodesulfobacterium sp.]
MKNIGEIKKIFDVYKPILKEKFKVKEIGIFGSYARGEGTFTSDIDILVDFEKEGKTFDNYMELKYFLEELLGLEVDLVMKGALKKELKDVILKEVIYV